MKLNIHTEETPSGGHVVNIESSRPSIWALIPGLLIFAVGAAILYPEIRNSIKTTTEPHIWHLVLSGGICLLGVIVPFYRQVIPGVKQLLIVLGNSSLPVIGGRRSSDPPGPPPPNLSGPTP